MNEDFRLNFLFCEPFSAGPRGPAPHEPHYNLSSQPLRTVGLTHCITCLPLENSPLSLSHADRGRNALSCDHLRLVAILCCESPDSLWRALQRRPPRATRGWSKDETPSSKRPGSRIRARAIEKTGSVSCCRRRGSQMSVLWRASARHSWRPAGPWAEAHGGTLKRTPQWPWAPR